MTTPTAMSATLMEQMDILRRILERGRRDSSLGARNGRGATDSFQHALDELTRLRAMLGLSSLPLTRGLFHD
jgi:hypothetical protein